MLILFDEASYPRGRFTDISPRVKKSIGVVQEVGDALCLSPFGLSIGIELSIIQIESGAGVGNIALSDEGFALEGSSENMAGGALASMAGPSDFTREQVSSAPDIAAASRLESSSFAAAVTQKSAEYEQDRIVRLSPELSFKEYLQELYVNPSRVVRSVCQYQVDAFEHYGAQDTNIGGQTIRDFSVKHFPWHSEQTDRHRELIGQEVPTFAYYQFCKESALQERPQVMVCIHGQSGGGKTTFFQMRDEMLEDYSTNHPEGALYRLVWKFSAAEKEGIGFIPQEKQSRGAGGHGANEVRIPADNNTDPFFLLSREHTAGKSESPRELVMRSLEEQGRIDQSFNRNYFLSDGLDPLSKTIMSHLLKKYDGDLEKILERHVAVERWSYSSRMGEGIVSLKPNPDAHADNKPILHGGNGRGVPDALSSIQELVSTGGLFLRANRGVMHYCDMLRPNQMDRGEADLSRFNFLLDTVESGNVQVLSHRDPTTLRNVPSYVFLSSDTNDENIVQKMRAPGFEQLRERMHFITFPLVSRFDAEAEIYRSALGNSTAHREPERHALETLALFSTATRLLSPDPFGKGYSPPMMSAVRKLSSVGKALLLNEGTSPTDLNLVRSEDDAFTPDELKVLFEQRREVIDEFSGGVGKTRFWLYDGGLGMSTRTAVKLAQHMVRSHPDRALTCMDVIEELSDAISGGLAYFEDIKRTRAQLTQQVERELKEERGSKVTENDVAVRVRKLFPAPDAKILLDEVTSYAKQKIGGDIAQAMGLLTGDAADQILLRYVWHVRAHLSGGNSEVPPEYRVARMRGDGAASEAVMAQFENTHITSGKPATPEDRQAFRRGVLRQVASWQIENPAKRFDQNLGEALPTLLTEVQQSGVKARAQSMKEFLEVTKLYGNDPDLHAADLQSSDKALQRRAELYYDVIRELGRVGYQADTVAKEVVWALS